MTISLYNTLTRKKEEFKPADPQNVRMYVCGPTVYDRPHLGNARSVVVYDVLFRLLKHLYEKDGGKVTYVRNITDVDDKINAAAKKNGEPISALTKRVEGWFNDDMAALNCLPPTIEPHATAHIGEMIAIIKKLIAGGHAYVSAGHVLFRVASYGEYGALSGRKLEDLIAGARVETADYKENAGDFVLWKPADAGDDASSVFDSPWGAGRPGWHIECSAMSSKYLGDDFDIHGGGADLMFPHHENEIAQSRCSAPHSNFAKYWVHNGFLTVNGEKMSKSLGNFTTVKDVLDKGVRGEVIRFALLSTHYRAPLDWNEKLLHDAKVTLDKFNSILENTLREKSKMYGLPDNGVFIGEVANNKMLIASIADDLNTSKAISFLHEMVKDIQKANSPKELSSAIYTLENSLEILGLNLKSYSNSMRRYYYEADLTEYEDIKILLNERITAKKEKNWARADEIRKKLAEDGVLLEDKPDGTTDWRRG